MRELKETHQKGFITVENIPDELAIDAPKPDLPSRFLMRTGGFEGDFGIQIAEDGRVWVCINGIAFLRFKPKRMGFGTMTVTSPVTEVARITSEDGQSGVATGANRP